MTTNHNYRTRISHHDKRNDVISEEEVESHGCQQRVAELLLLYFDGPFGHDQTQDDQLQNGHADRSQICKRRLQPMIAIITCDYRRPPGQTRFNVIG